jgi:D-beta-D-heptose 7-phosphate kinase/D-beta-D-heptose 1-phosphate adenosyltransferase
MGRLLSLKKVCALAESLRREGKRIVFTNGCFDILHAGHVRYLKKAKNLGDVLIVGLNSDSSVRKIKGKDRPINNQKDRAEVLSALESVDYVVIFAEETPEKLIKMVMPDVLVKGSDWKGKKIAGGDIVKKNGGRVVLIPLLKGRSTTKVIQKIKEP